MIEGLMTFSSNMSNFDAATPTTAAQQTINRPSTKPQQSVNDFHYCIVYTARPLVLHLPMIKILPMIIADMLSFGAATPEIIVK
jgi:hypothetical protein